MTDAMKYEDWLRGCVRHDGRKGNVYLPCDIVLEIADWIEAHRDVAPVRHGHWFQDAIYYGEDGSPCIVDICTECGAYGYYADFNYCPNCGAKMYKENDND